MKVKPYPPEQAKLYLKAVNTLIGSYKLGEKTTACPLCRVGDRLYSLPENSHLTSICTLCPWMVYKGHDCMSFPADIEEDILAWTNTSRKERLPRLYDWRTRLINNIQALEPSWVEEKEEVG